MKNTVGIIAGMLLLQSMQAQLFVDQFSYPNGNLGASGIGDALWTGGDSPATAITVSSTATLEYSGLAASTGSGLIFSGGTFKKKAAPFASQSGNGTTVYFSFLLNIQTGPSTVKAFVYLQNGNSASSSPPLGIFLNGSQVGLAKSASSPAVSSSSLNSGTHLIVARYSFLSGNDQVDLWIDPASLGDNGAVPNATLTTGTASSSDASALSYIFLNHAASQTLWVDEIRVGTTWAEVTPASGVISPSFIPCVTQTLLSSDGLIMRGTNGPANSPYAVVATTDLALPRNQWSAVNSNAFDVQGNFDCTNAIAPEVAARFYQIRVGVIPPPPVPPTIVTNPLSKTVAVGQNVTFTVAATGTTPLVYRWYFNTNTLLASTTATLTINNAQLTNAGVYSAIVSNVAGTAASDFATLAATNILAPPSITVQPQNQSAVPGQPAMFSVTATGTAPLTYQWYFNTNTALLDKTNSSLLISSVTSNDVGSYSVVVSNALGWTNSAVATLTIVDAPTNGNRFVSPTGSDSNPGTIELPFYSLSNAVAVAQPGDIIYMRGGTFTYSATVRINKAGTALNPFQIVAYPGEHPILDYSTWHPATETIRGGARGIYITTNAQYWVLKGLEIQYAPDNGIKSEGGHITFEQCIFHHNGDGGLQIGLNKDTLSFNPDPEHAAAYNYVLNCDAYRNADPATDYENADGFACKLYAGVGNHFYGCRAWENCDDGWDCYQTEYEIVIEHCWSWHNGDPSIWGFSSFNGDGNGFKLGGDNTFCPILVQNCVALNCNWGTTVGFAYNNNTAPITLYNCSSLNCGRSYKFGEDGNVFKNCLDWNSTRPAPVDISGTSTQVNNSWNLPVTVTVADFASVSETDAVAPREADGSLPNNGFARLVSGSDLIDKGVDVGLPYNGSAPDLGAFEY